VAEGLLIMKILLAVDGSECSTRAVRYVAKHLDASTPMLLLHADPPLRGVALDVGARNIALYHADNHKAAVRAARRVLKQAGVPFRELLLVGHPDQAIVRTAKKEKVDVIVMGSRGNGVLANLLLGSVVTKVLASTQIPVLVVR
jgi:nucleotide-binding universal stress UspA family protein